MSINLDDYSLESVDTLISIADSLRSLNASPTIASVQTLSLRTTASTPSEGLTYELNENSYTVTGIGTCTDTDIVIPSTYNSLPVTRIGDSAFRYNTSITSVVIPEGVTSIGSSAFGQSDPGSGDPQLTQVTLPDSITEIGDDAFYGNTSLSTINIPSNVVRIGVGAFGYCALGDNNIALPETLTYLGDGAFEETHVNISVIPENVEYIGELVFGYCEIERLTFKGTPETIHQNALGTSGIQALYVPWSEGEVENAPWGADDARIYYNNSGANNENVAPGAALTIDDMITAMSGITTYKYMSTTLPEATAFVITDYEKVTLIEKSKLTLLANAARNLCSTDFSSEKLQLSQIDSIMKSLEGSEFTSYEFRAVCYCCDDAPTTSYTVSCENESEQGTIDGEISFDFVEGSCDLWFTFNKNVKMHITNMYQHGFRDTASAYPDIILYEDVIEGTFEINGDSSYRFSFSGDTGRSSSLSPDIDNIQDLHDGASISICVEIPPYSDYSQEIKQFYIENMGTIPATGGTSGGVTISDVSTESVWVESDGNPYTEVCWTVVRYTVTLSSVEYGGETIYIRPEMYVPGMGDGIEAEWAIIGSNGDLMSTNDDGVIEGQTTSMTYTVTNYGDYGFEKDSSGYYVSQNGGVENSYALCRVVFNVPNSSDIQIEVVCSGETNYDYGIVGNIDQELSRDNDADSDYHFNFSGYQLPHTETITFSNVASGTHFVEIKYRKDVSVNSNDDCVSFKVLTGTDNGTSGGESGGGESGDPISSEIYITGYYGYMSSGGSEIQLVCGDETVNSVVGSVTVSGDDESFEINGTNGECWYGHYKCIYTGYYSEYGNESCYNYYITGTLSSPLILGTNYRIVVKNNSGYEFEDTYSLILGDDMEYIPEPTDQGDLSESSKRTFTYTFGVDEGEGWADAGFYITVYVNGYTYSTALIDGVGTYYFTNGGSGQIVITRWEHTEQDIGWIATMLEVEGTISDNYNLTKMVAHEDPTSPDSGYYVELTVE